MTDRLQLLEAYREDGKVSGELQEAFALELQILKAVALRFLEEEYGDPLLAQDGGLAHVLNNMQALTKIAGDMAAMEFVFDPDAAEAEIESEVEHLAERYARQAAEKIASGEDPASAKAWAVALLKAEAADGEPYPRWAKRHMLDHFEKKLGERKAEVVASSPKTV